MKDPEILYEDDHILALNKSAGMVVHHDSVHDEALTDWLLKKYPAIKDVGEPMMDEDGEEISRPGIVHRLDKETSGVLLVAKTKEGFESLKQQFQERNIKKTYIAFVKGKINEERGVINTPIGRSSIDARKRVAKSLTGGNIRGEVREARTTFSVRKTTPEATLIEARPETGRTHQIRVHFKSIHHPVLCDSLYGGRQSQVLGFKRLALHARKIVFKDMNGKKHEVVAPFPSDFKNALEKFGILENNLR